MIESKLTAGSRVITADVFPEVGSCKMVTDGIVCTSYYDNQWISTQTAENRVGRFILSSQSGQTHEDCCLEVKRTGIPVLMMTLAKQCSIVRSRNDNRRWHSGDVGLTLTPQEDVVINQCTRGNTMNLFNIIIPEPVVRQAADRHPEALAGFCRDFEREQLIDYNKANAQASHKLLCLIRSIERCNDMGNYADKYLETKILECLTEYLYVENGITDKSLTFNFVMRDKMYDARQIMAARYQNPPSLSELAVLVGTNECSLKSAFKQVFGTTVFQFLFDFRMELAVHYLLDTHFPLSEISLQLGFYDQSHFCTAFRRKFGMSPSEFKALRG